jgi:hypothetical protein
MTPPNEHGTAIPDPFGSGYVGGLMVALEIVQEQLSIARKVLMAVDDDCGAESHVSSYPRAEVNALQTVETRILLALHKYTGEGPKP